MDLRGLQKVSLIDYPDSICATIFAGGCNLRCLFCHNRDLVLNPGELPAVEESEIMEYLVVKGPLLDGICISGGEPTLQDDLMAFIIKVKKIGLKVKLDTNGTRPEVIRNLLGSELLDYIAVDIKAPLDKYVLIAGDSEDLSRINETIDLLKNSIIDQEFRTTVVPGLLDENDILRIAKRLAGCRKYVLQQFRPQDSMIDRYLISVKPYSLEIIERVADSCREYIEVVELRGF
ncbi:MAG: anaerobic ribonucleoside-triphosphate reductase activating protein [Bacillota bacterium]|nr:anaerobic ribonucleoside-triphosphate reductase activating protein [Bacillota bacterium]